MPGRIPQAFIDELMNRVDIVDVIDSRVQLKKAGHEYKACCPFHNEKTPSFTVSPSKQFYHCFGCGAHGTALGFLMEYEHLGFVEAIEDLAGQVGLEIPYEQGQGYSSNPETGKLYDILEQAAVFFQQQLRSHPQAGQAVDYLKGRGFSGEIAARYGFGYAPPGWNSLIDSIGREPSALKQLIAAGLVIEQGRNGPYDRFRNRIMIPILDRRGRTIAFGGRLLESGSADASGPKYLNSPETPVFHKGRELYGLYQARKTGSRLQRLLVVEGYLDVVALAQHGIDYAVATLGTATTPDHMEVIYRTVNEVIFCFDGDRAGRAAAWRALENALPAQREGREARFLFLPEGEDPDTMIRSEGKQAFEARFHEAQPLSTYLFDTLMQDLDMDSVDGRARLVAAAKPLLEKIPDPVYRQMMQDQLAKLARINSVHLGHAKARPQQHTPARPHSPTARTPVRLAIAIILQHPALVGQLAALPSLSDIQRPGMDLLCQLLEMLAQDPHLNSAALLERWRDTEYAGHLSKLAQMELFGEQEGLLAELQDTLERLSTANTEQRIDELYAKILEQTISESELSEYNQLLANKRQHQIKSKSGGN